MILLSPGKRIYMFNDIPYFKNNTIKNIRIDNDDFVVIKYVDEFNTYEEHRSVVDNEFNAIKEEYYSTLKEYLDSMKYQYKIKLSKSINNIENKRNKYNKLLVLLL